MSLIQKEETEDVCLQVEDAGTPAICLDANYIHDAGRGMTYMDHLAVKVGSILLVKDAP